MIIGNRIFAASIMSALSCTLSTCSGHAQSEPQLFVGIKYNPAAMSVGGSGFSRYDLLLLPDGRALSLTPGGGDLYLTEAEWQSIEPRYRGTWTKDGNEVRLNWPNRRSNQRTQIYLRIEDGLRINDTQLERINCGEHSKQLSGSYRARTLASTGTRQMRTGEINFASERQLSFSADGSVSAQSRSGFSTDTTRGGRIIGTDAGRLSGTYTWQHCRLTITPSSGNRLEHTAFFWPGEKHKTLVLDGRIYDRTDR